MHVRSYRSHGIYLLAWITLTIAAAALAEEIRKFDVRTTALERPTASNTTVRFQHGATQVGDQVEQTIEIEMRLAMSIRDGNVLTEQGETSVRRVQRRVVTTTAVRDGRTNEVLVRYLASHRHAIRRNAEDAANEQSDAARPAPQPVAGKAYRCRREGEKLIVTDEQGKIPPIEEFQIVAQDMEAVGLPNPLAEYLAGRTVAVSETLELPREVADQLFGLGEQFGETAQFELTLRELQTVEGVPCAVFEANIEASASGSSQMRLQVTGPLVVEVDTCRAVRTEFVGPLATSESRGTHSTAYQLIGTGKLAMRIDSSYHDVRR